MKLLISLLGSGVHASHYRGGTYKFRPNDTTGKIEIEVTQVWRQGWSGHDNCEESVANKWSSSRTGWDLAARCINFSQWGGVSNYCDGVDLNYVATFSGGMHYDGYCYGDGTHQMANPGHAFSLGWWDCCWVRVNGDDGVDYRGGDMHQIATVFDTTNNSPTYTIPPQWKLLAGCPNQKFELNPVDVDGDNTRCRWANDMEAGGVVHDTERYGSLTLDETNCVITYDGTKDATTEGVKPVAIMIEDLTDNNEVRSAIPVQFLGLVWTPTSGRILRNDKPNFPNWFAEKGEHKHGGAHDFDPATRKRRSTPAYCSQEPTFEGTTPLNNDIINTDGNELHFNIEGVVNNSGDKTFANDALKYQAPVGLECTQYSGGTSWKCVWALNDAQMAIPKHKVCFYIADRWGLNSERRCIEIEPCSQTMYEAKQCGKWSEFDPCSASCEGGVKRRYWIKMGKQFPSVSNMEDVQGCNMAACPVTQASRQDLLDNGLPCSCKNDYDWECENKACTDAYNHMSYRCMRASLYGNEMRCQKRTDKCKVFGDPHVETFDRQETSFYGLNEYVLIQPDKAMVPPGGYPNGEELDFRVLALTSETSFPGATENGGMRVEVSGKYTDGTKGLIEYNYNVTINAEPIIGHFEYEFSSNAGINNDNDFKKYARLKKKGNLDRIVHSFWLVR